MADDDDMAKPKMDRLVSAEGGDGDDGWGAGGGDADGDAGGDDGWGAAGDGEDDGAADTGSDEKTGNKKLKLSRSASYTILENKVARQKKRDTITEMVTDLCVTEAEADVMLRAYRWNVKKLKEDWYETGKGKAFCLAKAGDKPQKAQPPAAAAAAAAAAPAAGKAADAKSNSSAPNAAAKALAAALGKPVPGSGMVAAKPAAGAPAAAAAPAGAVAGKTVQCQMAFCDIVPIEKAFSLGCGHWFCHDCWTGILSNAINTGRGCVVQACPGFICQKKDCQHSVKKGGCKCEMIIPEDVWRRFVTEKALIDKFETWALEYFVEGNKHYRFCPKPGCDRMVEYKKGGSREIRCACGKEYCFQCRRDPHNPAPCDLVAKWYEQGDSDKATQDLLAATAKACPNCKALITKDRACNHMCCAACKHHFCWLCKGAWSEHGSATGGYYVCNKYKEDQKQGKVSNEEKQITEKTKIMQKYMFFRQHFEHNRSAMEMAKKLLVKVEMQNQGEKFNFLEDALHKIIQCRHILQWTYALSYFMKNSSGKNLFEMQQTLLNNFTEETQELVEKHDNFSALCEPAQRKLLVTKAKLIADYAEKTMQSIEEGELVAILMYEADAHSSGGWTCTACNYTHEAHSEAQGSKKVPKGKDGKDDKKGDGAPAAAAAGNNSAADLALNKINKNIKFKGTAQKSEHEKYAGELYCAMCSACRQHGEQDCKACKPKQGTGWGF